MADEKPIKKLLMVIHTSEVELAAATREAMMTKKSYCKIFLFDTLSPNGIMKSNPKA